MSTEFAGSAVGAAAGAWPFVVTMAVAVAGGKYRDRRIRRTLNERLHELRRPLQTLALQAKASPEKGPDPLEMALAALRDLDREVNGDANEFRRRPVEARMLAVAACERWRIQVAAAGRRIGVRWRCGDELANCDPVRVSQALDNLIANALEHGRGEITIEGACHRESIDLIVRDRGHVEQRTRSLRDPRRGHGLRLTRSLALKCGGSLTLRSRSRGGTTATLVLPLASPRPIGDPHRL